MNVSMDIFNELPIFDGNKKMYQSWRSKICVAMEPLVNQQTTMKHCQALLIIISKITGTASHIVNGDTKFDFEHIIKLLDSAFIDNEPLKILEQNDERNQPCVSQANDSGNDAVNQTNPLNTQSIKLIHEETVMTETESNKPHETIQPTQQEENIYQTSRVNGKNWKEFSPTTIFLGPGESSINELTSKRLTNIRYSLFELIFLTVRSIDRLINHNNFIRENRHSYFKYFRKKIRRVYFDVIFENLIEDYRIFDYGK